jgi:hypothetical protein
MAKSKRQPPDVIKPGVAARLLRLSERRVQDLARLGWIARPYTVEGVVQGYLKFFRDEQRRAARVAVDGVVQRERARKLKIGNDLNEASLVEVGEVVATLDDISGQVKAGLVAIVAATDDVVLRHKLGKGIDEVLTGIARRSERAVSDLVAGRDVANGADGANGAADDGAADDGAADDGAADDAEQGATLPRLQ